MAGGNEVSDSQRQAINESNSDKTCNVKNSGYANPKALMKDFLDREHNGRIFTGDWSDTAFSCPGHLVESDSLTVSTGYTFRIISSSDAVITFLVEYKVAGNAASGSDGIFEIRKEKKQEVVVYLAIKTKFGWRLVISNNIFQPHLFPKAILAKMRGKLKTDSFYYLKSLKNH